jgi:hypothetical protein
MGHESQIELCDQLGCEARKIPAAGDICRKLPSRTLDHVIAINESHLKRLLACYVDYYHQDRTHCDFRNRHRISDRLAYLEAQSLRGLVSEVFIIVTSDAA